MTDGAQPPSGDEPLTTMHLGRAVAGSEDSMQWIVQRLTPLLHAHATYRLGTALRQHCDPDDLVQDAWLATLPKLSVLVREHGQRRTPVVLKYLCTTIVYRIGKLARRHVQGIKVDAVAPDGVAAAMSGAVTRAMQREQHEEIYRGIEELDDKDRQVLLLRGIEQRSAAEVAVMLSLSAEAVHKRYQRALARLRNELPASVFDELDD